MAKSPLFEGLIRDEQDRAVGTATVGGETFYVVDDAGFKRHVPSREIDLAVLHQLTEVLKGHENFVSREAAKMLGQSDIFSRAMIEEQLKHMDKQFEVLLDQGMPAETRAYLGMLGMKIVLNVHGEIVSISQPSGNGDGEGE